jgi:uncharacterized protein YajQ (UPF0234 family)
MAKASSFDIVSKVDLQEADNAVQQASSEIRQRYDLKDTGASVALDKTVPSIEVRAPSDFVANQVIDLLGTKLVRRKVDLKAVTWGAPERAGGDTVKVTAAVADGIDADTARRINKDIKAEKFKAQVQIEGDKLRVSSPKKDVLQDVIAFVKEKDYGVPLQFVNYR